jgi:hypothetical protein
MNTKIFYLFAVGMFIVASIAFIDSNYGLSHGAMGVMGFNLAVAMSGEL